MHRQETQVVEHLLPLAGFRLTGMLTHVAWALLQRQHAQAYALASHALACSTHVVHVQVQLTACTAGEVCTP